MELPYFKNFLKLCFLKPAVFLFVLHIRERYLVRVGTGIERWSFFLFYEIFARLVHLVKVALTLNDHENLWHNFFFYFRRIWKKCLCSGIATGCHSLWSRYVNLILRDQLFWLYCFINVERNIFHNSNLERCTDAFNLSCLSGPLIDM